MLGTTAPLKHCHEVVEQAHDDDQSYRLFFSLMTYMVHVCCCHDDGVSCQRTLKYTVNGTVLSKSRTTVSSTTILVHFRNNIDSGQHYHYNCCNNTAAPGAAVLSCYIIGLGYLHTVATVVAMTCNARLAVLPAFHFTSSLLLLLLLLGACRCLWPEWWSSRCSLVLASIILRR